MHELSLAFALIEQVVGVAKKNGIATVDEVEIEIGELRQVIPEIMNDAFREVSKKTPAENAKLLIYEIPVRARCNSCQHEFSPTLDSLVCGHCKRADVEVLAGDDIVLKTVTGE